MTKTLTPELLLSAYAQGIFPMAPDRHSDTLHWYRPEQRGILPLDDFHAPKSLAKFMKKRPYDLTINQDFRAVITACADTPRGYEKGTWINDEIIEAYCALHALGHAHSVEVWQEEALVGGLYGVSLKRAFFGESMFSRAPNASKIALVHLVGWLRENNYTLLDTQYVNEHLLQFGVREIPRGEYMKLLQNALST
ncbi:MAG: leucyl/phenylalanyl-tRNA--protein transferase [Alphaproteobacteria bacterium]|nr:leucyl/phenylalanyl-tRNA--protein transferase [Alphaproteobacteria bacterium]